MRFLVAIKIGVVVLVCFQSEDTFKYAPTKEFDKIGKYVVKYNKATHNPTWVLERLTIKNLEPVVARRENLVFSISKLRDQNDAVDDKDYDNSGYDRGHLAAAGNYASSAEDKKNTFTYDNCVPQSKDLNRKGWYALEQYVRNLVRQENVVHVITLPLYNKDSKKIGKHKVYVPSHCAKTVLIEGKDGKYRMQAWLMPNTLVELAEWDRYRITVDELEKFAELDFWADLPDDLENQLEAVR